MSNVSASKVEMLISKIDRTAKISLKSLILIFLLSLVLIFWNAMIIYISFYLLLWGIIPVSLIIITIQVLKKYSILESYD